MDSGFRRNDGNPGIGGVFQQILVGRGLFNNLQGVARGPFPTRLQKKNLPESGRSRSRTRAVRENGPLQITLDQDGKSSPRQRGQSPFSGSPPNPSPTLCVSELPHEAKLGPGALVVVELGVGLALFVHHDELGAEAEGREAAVEDRGAEYADLILA